MRKFESFWQFMHSRQFEAGTAGRQVDDATLNRGAFVSERNQSGPCDHTLWPHAAPPSLFRHLSPSNYGWNRTFHSQTKSPAFLSSSARSASGLRRLRRLIACREKADPDLIFRTPYNRADSSRPEPAGQKQHEAIRYLDLIGQYQFCAALRDIGDQTETDQLFLIAH
jgi:hypothetical protein